MTIHGTIDPDAHPDCGDCRVAAGPLRFCHRPDSECGRGAPQFDGESAVREQERGRIGRELHDSTAQALVALQLKILYLKEMSDDPAYRGRWTDVERSIHDLHQEIRAVSAGCGLPGFFPGDLATALRDMCRRLGELTGLEITFEAREAFDRGTAVATLSLYRMAQELLANVVRHARASNVAVQLTKKGGNLVLRIADDGVGLPTKRKPAARGNGLENVRLRARELNGRLVQRRRKQGSSFTVAIPHQFADPPLAATT